MRRQDALLPLLLLLVWASWVAPALAEAEAQAAQNGVNPKLPWRLKATLRYHHFFSDHNNVNLGDEFDARIDRPIGRYVNIAMEAACFSAASGSFRRNPMGPVPLASTYRVKWDVTFKF